MKEKAVICGRCGCSVFSHDDKGCINCGLQCLASKDDAEKSHDTGNRFVKIKQFSTREVLERAMDRIMMSGNVTEDDMSVVVGLRRIFLQRGMEGNDTCPEEGRLPELIDVIIYG